MTTLSSALSRWIKLFSEVKIDDQTVMTRYDRKADQGTSKT